MIKEPWLDSLEKCFAGFYSVARVIFVLGCLAFHIHRKILDIA